MTPRNPTARRRAAHARLLALLALGLTGEIASPAVSAAQEAAAAATFEPVRADGNGVAALARVVALHADAEPIADVLRRIVRDADLDLVFRSDLPDLGRRITIRRSDATVAAALLLVLRGTRLDALVSPDGRVVVMPKAPPVQAGAARITGIVREAETRAPVDAATIELDGARTAVTDAAGSFRFADVAPGPHSLVVRRLGYTDAGAVAVQVEGGTDAHVEIELAVAPTPLAAVVVTPGTYGMLERGATSRQSLSREQIETQPQLGDDIFRAVSRLPGVSSQDMSAAFGVRGGANRELLVRLDGLELSRST